MGENIRHASKEPEYRSVVVKNAILVLILGNIHQENRTIILLYINVKILTMSTETPTENSVWNSRSSNKEDEVICPDCGEKVFRFVPVGSNTTIDTIGSIKICSTEQGTYFHGN